MIYSLLVLIRYYSLIRNKPYFLTAGIAIIATQLIFFTDKFSDIFAINISNFLFAVSIFVIYRVSKHIIYIGANNYGFFKIEHDEKNNINTLLNGHVIHGMQCLDKDLRDYPSGYYHQTGPVGQFFSIFEKYIGNRPIAAIGLGPGVASCYAKPKQIFDYYEINPLIKNVALNPEYFTYLSNSKGRINIIMGDAILTMQNVPSDQYGLLIIDAYNGRDIPTNIFNEEALLLYSRILDKDGVIMFHISSDRDICEELKPLLEKLKITSYVNSDPNINHFLKINSSWLLIIKNPQASSFIKDNESWKLLTG